MKAKQHFVIHVTSSGERITTESNNEGNNQAKDCKVIIFKPGDVIPDKYVKQLLLTNLHYLDVEFVHGRIQLDEKEKAKYDYAVPEVTTPKTMQIKKRAYSQESLTILYNEEGRKAILEVAKGFKIPTGRRHSVSLINEILVKQESEQI